MVRVKKANVEFRVADEKLDEYLALGFSQIDDNGNVVRASTKNGADKLAEENAVLKKRIAELEAEIAALKEAKLADEKNGKKA